MQKTRRLHRLLAVLVAVFLAVCCLPTSAFAAQSKISSHVFVTLKLDGEEKGKKDFWLGDLPYEPGSPTTKVAWSTLLDKLDLPENTQVKADTNGDCELPLKLSGAQEPPTFRSDLTVELERLIQLDFTVRYVGSGSADLGSQQVSLQFGPSTAPDAWKYISESEKYKSFNAPLKELKIEQDGDKAYTGEGQLQISAELQGKTLVAYLDKSSDTDSKTVNFSLRYLSTDNRIQDTQPATLSYTFNDAGTDLWNFVMDQDAYKTYEAQGYKMEDYVIPAAGGERLCDKQGLQNVNADLEGKEIIVHLVKKTEAKAEQVPFRLHYLSTDGSISDEKSVEVPYDPNGKSYDLWSYIEDSRIYKAYQKDGYTLKNFVVPHLDGNKTYTAAGQFTVTPVLKGAIVTVTLDKTVVSTKKTVDFTLQYMSNDKILDTTRRVSAQYDPEGELTDLWDYLKDTGTVQAAVKSGYTLQDYVLDNNTYKTGGIQAVNGDLAGKTVVVHLYKEPVSSNKTVDFTLRYLSTDNQIQKSQAISLVYDPNGELTDVWDFVMAQEPYKTYAAQDYTLSDYVIPAQGNDRVCEHRGMQAVTTDLQGKEIVVHLVKKSTAKTEMVDFTLRFLSDDGKIDVTKQASVTYDPNTKGFDAWNYLDGTATARSYGKDGYHIRDFTVSQPAGEASYTAAGQFTVTPALAGKTVTVHLAPPPAHYESSYIVHFVDEQGKEFQSAATVKVSWTEGQQLNLMAQLKDTLAAVGAKGYTFKTLTGWNGTNVYKGTELVVPGSWELTAHCVKNPAPAKPAENKPAQAKPAQTKPAENKPVQTKAKPAAQQVVKAAAPAANSTKILPKTGLQAQTPVVFGVMLFAALAGAAVYLFALRKKLN